MFQSRPARNFETLKPASRRSRQWNDFAFPQESRGRNRPEFQLEAPRI